MTQDMPVYDAVFIHLTGSDVRAVSGRPSDMSTGGASCASAARTQNKIKRTLLSELHKEGATICMVTHDPRYARCAERSITLFDGRIVEEIVTANATASAT